jgi:hypothetical protein
MLLLILTVTRFNITNSDIIWACGIFAFIGTNPTQHFTWDKFTILGLYNDSRGGDACGRVCGSLVQHGVGLLDTYKAFIVENPNPKTTLSNTILGHCRKASVGGLSVAYAQPIVLRRKDLNMKAIRDTHLKKDIRDLPGDTVIFSGAHNGTIDNYKELAPKYGIPVEEHNDSKVLLSALFYGNFEVLNLYRGTAALVWHNHITNKTYVFRGESKANSYAKIISEERPLYYYKVASGNIYLSSIPESLAAIGGTKETIANLAPNIVTIFKDGKKLTQLNIDRSKAFQKEYEHTAHVDKRAYDSYYKGREAWSRDEYEGDSVWPPATPSMRPLPPYLGPIKKNNKIVTTKEIVTSNPFVRLFEDYAEPFRLQAEVADTYYSRATRRVCYNKGRYWMSGGLMHGVYVLNGMGMVPVAINLDINVTKIYCFVEGIMMDGATGYNKAIAIHKEFMQKVLDDIPSLVDREQELTRSLVKYSRFPTVSLTGLTGEQDCLSQITTANGNNFYDGLFHPLFSDREYMFENGDLINIRSARDGLKTINHDMNDTYMAKLYVDTCRDDPSKDSAYRVGTRLVHIGGFDNPLSPFQSLVFAFLDPEDSLEVELMLIHYVRDFRDKVKEECSMCLCKKTRLKDVCLKCDTVSLELKELAKDIDYELFREPVIN